MSRRVLQTCFNYYSPFATNKLALDCSRHLTCHVFLPTHSFVPRAQGHGNRNPAFFNRISTHHRNTELSKAVVKEIVSHRKKSKLKLKRLADSDSNDRRLARESQLMRIPGFKSEIMSYGRLSEGEVSVGLLHAFLDAHLKGKLKAAQEDRWSDYYHLICAAAKAGNLDVVFMLQKNFLQAKDKLPTLDGIRTVRTVNMCAIWSMMLEQVDEMQDRGDPTAKVHVERMLCHWRAIGHVPHVDVINQLSSWFMKYYGDSDVVHLDVKMPKNGECPITGKSLERLDLLEFDKLKAKFLNDVLVRKNVYINADPEDMSALSEFIKTCGPFDVVIDGLNVCYHDNQIETSPQLMMRQVLQVVKFLRFKMKRRVAVISRDWWERHQYKPIVNELRQHASVFTTHRMTEDDLFTLHCCLESGPQCYIVTNDLMRDHRSKWNDELRPAFAHWQHARQIHVHSDQVRNKLALITPRQYLTAVQEVDGTLFIPHHKATEHEILHAHTRMDMKDGVSIDEHFRIPNSFLVINPGKSFFQTQTMPSWASV